MLPPHRLCCTLVSLSAPVSCGVWAEPAHHMPPALCWVNPGEAGGISLNKKYSRLDSEWPFLADDSVFVTWPGMFFQSDSLPSGYILCQGAPQCLMHISSWHAHPAAPRPTAGSLNCSNGHTIQAQLRTYYPSSASSSTLVLKLGKKKKKFNELFRTAILVLKVFKIPLVGRTNVSETQNRQIALAYFSTSPSKAPTIKTSSFLLVLTRLGKCWGLVCNFPLIQRDHSLKSLPQGIGTHDHPALRVPPVPPPPKRKGCKWSFCPWLIHLSSKRNVALLVGSMTSLMKSTFPYMFLTRSHGGPVPLSKLTVSRCPENRSQAQRAICNLVLECLCSCKCKVSLILCFMARGFWVA